MKPKRIISPKLRKSARGRDCTLNIPGVCSFDPEKTVLVHLQFEGGKMGSKADDTSACYGCSNCNFAIDNYLTGPEERWFYMGRALARTINIWVTEDLL